MPNKDRRAKNIFGTKDKPRFAVYRSLKNMYVQIIDDELGKTIVATSTIKEKSSKNNIETAKKIGLEIGKKALAAGVKKVVFDRRERLFHGRLKAIADGAREAGLEF
ncbi:MAG: 50S ribosomal protein L18 [Candidatus Margulisbacteria bacterium]|nr:50S ribosomal protein L18 [Candidatus Margulisiibacteriota bacterium]